MEENLPVPSDERYAPIDDKSAGLRSVASNMWNIHETSHSNSCSKEDDKSKNDAKIKECGFSSSSELLTTASATQDGICDSGKPDRTDRINPDRGNFKSSLQVDADRLTETTENGKQRSGQTGVLSQAGVCGDNEEKVKKEALEGPDQAGAIKDGKPQAPDRDGVSELSNKMKEHVKKNP